MHDQSKSSGLVVGVDTGSTLSERLEAFETENALPPKVTALCVVWAAQDVEAVGSLFAVPSGRPSTEYFIGRGSAGAGERHRLQATRIRPGTIEVAPPLLCRHISRVQLGVRDLGEGNIEVRRVGRCRVLHDGSPVETARVAVGETVQFGDHLLFLAVRVHAWLDGANQLVASFPFGMADENDIVGESAEMWRLRQWIDFVANKPGHVLITGPSGTGKELVAQALHRRSSRGNHRLVSRNAATFPDALIDAELFGNMRGYPNAGMPERLGLIGEADGGTLYLDEVGELPAALQTHLLRVLDSGEYHRLGESRSRCSKFRLVAATNRTMNDLRPDLLARLPHRISAPSLNERRQDIPMLAEHILQRIGRDDVDLHQRFFFEVNGVLRPRIAPAMVRMLIRHEYSTHVRELEALLWNAIAQSNGACIDCVRDLRHEMLDTTRAPVGDAEPKEAPNATRIQQVLDAHRGNIKAAGEELGLASRHVLVRLINKHRLRAGRNWTSNGS